MGLPCGTASRAREKPVSATLRAQGAPNPPPLRSATCPLGLPNLGPVNQARVDSANKLYTLAVEVLLFCHRRGIILSIENPANSWLWAALVQLTMLHSSEAAAAYNALEKVIFHACCHGSTRKKSTDWLGTSHVYTSLAATCQGDHEHEPWRVRWAAGAWVFDTAAEAAYPMLLAQRVAACMVLVANQRQFSLQAPLRLHDVSTAAQGKQSRKHPALIPEFHHFAKHCKDAPLPAGAKLLPPHLGGKCREEETLHNQGDGNFSKLGFFHTSKQFLSLAFKAEHPVDTTDHLEEVTRYALDFNLKYPAELVCLERKKNLLYAKLLAAQLHEKEAQFHASLEPCLAKVLAGKRLHVWMKLLEKYQYDDMAVCKFMQEGVRLVGMHDRPSCYPEKIKAASMTQQDLEQSAIWRRKAIVGKNKGPCDPTHVAHLEETAREELQMGFMEGPFRSEAEVTNYFVHDRWMVVRRFVLVQGAEMKLRPIHDCLEAQLNCGFTSTSYLKLQDVDYVASLALKIAQAVASGKQRHGSGRWQGKCLDLSKVYKQMGIHPSHRHLAVIYFDGTDGKPCYYVANSLMFGSTAVVYSFNRVSRSLWYLFNKMLLIPCGVFYDDFPLFSTEELAADADDSASMLLDILGWRHARTGPKGQPFATSFQVLVCLLDLSGIPRGELVTENKPGRLDRLQEQLAKIRLAGKLNLHEAQVLHGLLRYACGFFAGRHLFQVCAEVMNLVSSPSSRKMSNIVDFCDYASEMIASSQPRKISAFGERRPVLVFTDG
eukprot:s171_g30.t2